MKLIKRECDALLRRDLSSFIAGSFQALTPGETFKPNWHIDAIAWHLEQCFKGNIKRLLITVPPRHLKSICASVAFPAWVLGHDPTRRIISVSYSNDLARKHSADCRALMESNRYRELFPGTRLDPRKNTELEFTTTKRGFRFATSVGGTLTGRGGSIMIIDDPIKPADVLSEAERARVKQFYDATLFSRLDDKNKDVIILVMQRLHVDDLVAHVLESDDWVHLRIPAIAEENERYQIADAEFYERKCGEVLHPERESKETLDRIRLRIGTYNFSAQYQQNPIPPEGNLIRWSWFGTYDEGLDHGQFNLIAQSWDTASGLGNRNDFSVGTTWGVRDGHYYLLDIVRERLDYPTLRRRVVSEARRYQADAVLIEVAGAGLALWQDLRRSGEVRPIPISPKGDKEARVAAQSATIEAGRVLLPRYAPWLDEFRAEILAFPYGAYDDQVDSMVQLLNWMAWRQRRSEPRARPDPPRRPGHRFPFKEAPRRDRFDPWRALRNPRSW